MAGKVTAAQPTEEPSTPGDFKGSVITEVEKSELGCMLGAFRDVAHSIGMQVMAVTFEPGGNRVSPRVTGPPTLPKTLSRRDKKLVALVQTFADNALVIGFKLVKIDMKPVPRAQVNDRKLWRIRVDVVRSGDESAAQQGAA